MPQWAIVPISPSSVAVSLPERVVTNADLCERINSTPEWIEEKTGIRERRYLEPGTAVADLGSDAANKALKLAGIAARDVDILIVASTSPEWVLPSLSMEIAAQVGITTPRLIDLTQQACASSIYATYLAACMLQEPGLKTAVVVCVEAGSRVTDPADRTTRIYFGDAAGAIVYQTAAEGEGLLSYDLGHAYSDAVAMPGLAAVSHEPSPAVDVPSSPYLTMDGRKVWDEATTRLPKSISETLAAAGVDAMDVAGFALHQANVRLLQYIARSMGIDIARVGITADTLGNTAAASPVTSLERLARNGLAKRGDVIVLGAIGAGFLWGSMSFKLSSDIRVEA